MYNWKLTILVELLQLAGIGMVCLTVLLCSNTFCKAWKAKRRTKDRFGNSLKEEKAWKEPWNPIAGSGKDRFGKVRGEVDFRSVKDSQSSCCSSNQDEEKPMTGEYGEASSIPGPARKEEARKHGQEL